MRAWLRDRRRGPFTSNNPVRRNLMALNRAIQGADSDRRNERVRDQETSRAAIESFGWPHGTWHRLVETAYRPRRCHPISAEGIAISSAVNGRCSTSLVLEKVRPDDASWPKSAPNGDALRVRSFFANRAWLLRTPNAAILPINEAVEVKTRFVA